MSTVNCMASVTAAIAMGLGFQTAALAGLYQNSAQSLGGLATYWDMNESSGDALDSVGSLDLTLVNNPGRVTDATFDAAFPGVGDSNRVATFVAASNQSMTNSNPTALVGANSATLSYFVRVDGTPTLAVHMGPQRSAGQRYGFVAIHDGGNLRIITRQDNAVQTVMQFSDAPLLGGDWHHIAVTYHYDALDLPNSQVAFYLDGQLHASTAVTAGLYNDPNMSFFIGYDAYDGAGARYFNGGIDEVAIFDRALSAGEVATLYNTALIPEPTSLTMMGLGGLLLVRRRCWKTHGVHMHS